MQHIWARLNILWLLFKNRTTANSRRRAFTMIELIVVIAIIGLLAALISPHVTWMEPPQRTLQRAFLEAIDMAQSGISIRFRVDKEENIGTILVEVLTRGNENENKFESKPEPVWKAYKIQWQPTGKAWTFEPEIIYIFQNGMCTPAKITWGKIPYSENYLLSVTGHLVETDRQF